MKKRITKKERQAWLTKKLSHGGAREGAGRPKTEDTVVMRIPVSKVEAVKKLIKKN